MLQSYILIGYKLNYMEITGDMADLKLDNGKAENFNDQLDNGKEDDHEGSQNVEKKILVIKEDDFSTSNIVTTSQDPEVPQIGAVDHHHCLECKDDVQESNVIDSIESVQEDDHDVQENHDGKAAVDPVLVDEQRCIGHYTNKQKILLVGEVDHHNCLDCKNAVQENNAVDCIGSVHEDDVQSIVIDSIESVQENNDNDGKADVVVDEERCVGHYNNKQKILLVGEGDFSFASCLADAFVYASNIVATSLDSRDTILSRYSKGEQHLRNLEERGTVVLHEVNVDSMNNHPQLKDLYFDRIVFNFPHAGESYCGTRECQSWYIDCHKQVVSSFFNAAKHMLIENGEIHVTHKTAYPFSKWNIVELAMDHGLVLKREVGFCRWIYSGYENKKAYGSNWDNTFPVGTASTFTFCRS